MKEFFKIIGSLAQGNCLRCRGLHIQTLLLFHCSNRYLVNEQFNSQKSIFSNLNNHWNIFLTWRDCPSSGYEILPKWVQGSFPISRTDFNIGCLPRVLNLSLLHAQHLLLCTFFHFAALWAFVYCRSSNRHYGTLKQYAQTFIIFLFVGLDPNFKLYKSIAIQSNMLTCHWKWYGTVGLPPDNK